VIVPTSYGTEIREDWGSLKLLKQKITNLNQSYYHTGSTSARKTKPGGPIFTTLKENCNRLPKRVNVADVGKSGRFTGERNARKPGRPVKKTPRKEDQIK